MTEVHIQEVAPVAHCGQCEAAVIDGKVTNDAEGKPVGYSYDCQCGNTWTQTTPGHDDHKLRLLRNGLVQCLTCHVRAIRSASRGKGKRVERSVADDMPRAGVLVIKLNSASLTIMLDGEMLTMDPTDYKLVSDIRKLLRLHAAERSASVRDNGPLKPVMGVKPLR